MLMVFSMISACAPMMENITDYVPPNSELGMQCIEKANVGRNRCEAQQESERLKCVDGASGEAEYRFGEAERTYSHQLEDYINAEEQFDYDYEHYLEQKRLIIRDGELEYIQCSKDVNMDKIAQFPKCEKFLKTANKRAKKLRKPREPRKPRAPNLGRIYSRLVAQCNGRNNGCQQAFDQSYRSCGGIINVRQVCVSNCD